MGLLNRLFARGATSRRADAITLHAGQLLAVVGESHRQDALRRVASRTTDCRPYLADLTGRARKIAESEPDRRWFRAVLIPEPTNKYDRNAIAVHVDGVGLIGYLSRDDAVDYHPVFAALRARGVGAGTCPAMLVGGDRGRPSYGAVLCLSSATTILDDLNEARGN